MCYSTGQSYYIKAGRSNGQTYVGFSTDKENWTTVYGTGANMNKAWEDTNPNHLTTIGRADPNSYSYVCPFNGSIDLNETYFKKSGSFWFFRPSTNYLVKDDKLVFADSGLYIDDNGTKTYATANLAPVPSGFTYGNTTTTSIGFVDMRTQAFTAAPSGATIGKDE